MNLSRDRIADGAGFRLKDFDPADTGGFDFGKDDATAALAGGVERLSALQALLYAQDQWALLAVFQGMDAAGKDGTIKHVLSGVNPQGVEVVSFKQPGPNELAHDYLWRVHERVPARGRIGIFNRSHYEEVLVCRVHPALLEKQNLPAMVVGKKFWRRRFKDIRQFESYLARQGVVVLKFFLHLSRDEQKKRFLERLDKPEKNWKFSAADLAEREYWDAYQDAYEAAIGATAQAEAPWFVVPADVKRFAHLVVVEALVGALDGLGLHAPVVSGEQRAALKAARAKLEAE